MRILVACEFSGIVRRAFRDAGHNAISCDLLPADDGSRNHRQCDVRELLQEYWDALIAFPPCTHLASSGARWFKNKQTEQADAVRFVDLLWQSGIEKIAIENPIGVLPRLSTLGPASQIIQPWQFGHGEIKSTCLWLKGFPLLRPTDVVAGRVARVHREPPGPDRWKKRSITYQGIADAMASQWGK